VDQLWQLAEAQKILRKQLPDGSWSRSGEQKHPAINYHLIETWRWFRHLVEQYGFTRENPQAELAAEFLFSCQTQEGDFRGILANQHATYYTVRSCRCSSRQVMRKTAASSDVFNGC